ncbi:competence protein ComEA [Amphibacillus marinus]|uniref:Competence protein ComEA n=2 Tax=Amphibacillus marinus TaxID=872970 RepID=A0A1H8NTX6_9BACI|nr:competence protein ComEA [Amphibacillus marinus]
MKQWLIDHLLIVIVVFVLASGLIWEFGFSNSSRLSQSFEKNTLAVEEEWSVNDEQVDEGGLVDIKGAVYQPGVLGFEAGDRIVDLIEKAGGFTELADQTQVNLAERVYDEMIIYVPEEADFEAGISNQALQANQTKIRLNLATIEELQQLPGIGAKKAEAIIQYREQNGPFTSVEALTEVSGIGVKTIEKFIDQVTAP